MSQRLFRQHGGSDEGTHGLGWLLRFEIYGCETSDCCPDRQEAAACDSKQTYILIVG